MSDLPTQPHFMHWGSPTPPASGELYAGIDVGTNSVKMVIADLADGKAERVYEMSATTRIGEGMQAQGNRLREIPMRRTLDAIEALVAKAKEYHAETAAVATAALRDAVNREEFLQRVRERCGLNLEVIPGEEEARLSYLAARRDPHWRTCPHLMVIDVGGGSTELIQGESGTERIASRISVNLGAVKLTETYLKSDPPTIAQLTAANQAAANGCSQAQFTEEVGRPGVEAFQVVGIGGTLTNLGAMDLGGSVEPERLHGHRLTADALEDLIEKLASRTVEDRKQIPGLDPRRADILLGGAILLSQALARIGSGAVDVSTRGLRWGLLYDRFAPTKQR